LAPDLVVLQGAFGADASNAEAKAAVAELQATTDAQYGDVPLVVVTPFAPDGVTPQLETRESTLARAWREDPDTLVVRPQLEGWSDIALDDAGHALIAERLVEAFRTAGLAPWA
jgi:hypothetical protein